MEMENLFKWKVDMDYWFFFFNNENMCVLNTFSLINDSVEFQPIKMQSLYQ